MFHRGTKNNVTETTSYFNGVITVYEWIVVSFFIGYYACMFILYNNDAINRLFGYEPEQMCPYRFPRREWMMDKYGHALLIKKCVWTATTTKW